MTRHITIEIKQYSDAKFLSQEPTKETLKAIKKLVEEAEKKYNEPEERYFKCVNTFNYFTKNKIYKVGEQNNYPTYLTIESDKGNMESLTYA